MPRFGGGYLLYYLLWFGLSYLLANPMLLIGVIVFFVLRPVIPDPVVYFRSWARIRQLRRDVEINSANLVTRRDLAMLLLDRGRSKEARDVVLERDRVMFRVRGGRVRIRVGAPLRDQRGRDDPEKNTEN